MENKQLDNLDPTCYDFDLFSMDIYQNIGSIFNVENKILKINKLFMVATAGLDFDIRTINWGKNIHFINALTQSEINFEVSITKDITKIINKRYITEELGFNNEKSYLKTFTYFASKGFYAYDKKVEINNYEGFELIAWPKFDIKKYNKLFQIIMKIYYPEIYKKIDINKPLIKENLITDLINIEMTTWYKSHFNY